MPKNSEGYDWEKDLVSFLFVNLDRKGEDMSHSVNGRAFVIRDQKVNTAPRAVFNALNSIKRTEYEIDGNKDKEKVMKEKIVQLYFCKIMDPDESKSMMSPAEKAKAEAIENVVYDDDEDRKKAGKKAAKKSEEQE